MSANLPIKAILAILLLASPPQEIDEEHTIAIVGATVWTLACDPIENGTVVIRGSKIEAVGKIIPIPHGAQRIDGKGKIVMPGMIDAYTNLGLVEIGAVPVTRDSDEATDPVTPQMRVIDGLFPMTELIPVARVNGITSALTVPGEGNVLSGQSALIRLDGEKVRDLVIRFPMALHMNLGEPPKGRYGEKKKAPSTRMGIAAVARSAFQEAREYRKKRGRYEAGEEEEYPKRDLAKESLLRALDGEIPVIARAQRVDDILTAIRIAEEFELRLILARGAEAYQVADILAEKEIPVILGPVTTQPGSMETRGAIYENAARLHEAGVKFAIVTGSAHNVRNLPYEAGIAVAYGLPHQIALRAVTVHPAEILGVSDRLGTLESGKDADVIVLDGDPFQPLTTVEHVIIGGRDVPLTSHHTRLAEKYGYSE